MNRSGLFALLLFINVSSGYSKTEQVKIVFDSDSPVMTYGVGRLKYYLESAGNRVRLNSRGRSSGHTILLLTETPQSDLLTQLDLLDSNESLTAEAFRLVRKADTVFVVGGTDRGALYGILQLMEELGPQCDFAQVKNREGSPALAFRAIKFNLPWAPYRKGPANDLHLETTRDLAYWEAYLDMMVDNRFNALTMWSTHIFPYMIRAKNFPEATPFKDRELREWQSFWKTLLSMAKERGIETYLLNWNIVVSPEFAEAYGASVYFDRSDLVKRYTRESVTQLINEYEDLTGIGVTLSDWMGNWGEPKMTSREREEWIRDTFVEGMKDADRRIKFIHRSVLAGDPAEMREVIDYADLPDKTIVEVKFNWSHGHSTPILALTHSNDSGTIMSDFWEPMPENYFIAWTIRNEDFFVLRWGDPEFIREHIGLNNHAYVEGYFVGSEGYIPAKDYSHKEHPHKTWKYAFQNSGCFTNFGGGCSTTLKKKMKPLPMPLSYGTPVLMVISC